MDETELFPALSLGPLCRSFSRLFAEIILPWHWREESPVTQES